MHSHSLKEASYLINGWLRRFDTGFFMIVTKKAPIAFDRRPEGSVPYDWLESSDWVPS
ncbi:hypothetical protein CHCC15325_1488 [Bacillus licheniformis]|nr:hypothetical protein B4091_4230 [Bacillus licheniformis]TWJ49360.1 hypothetical protein CHCC5024_4231 [Bacillus licheniformis]TWK36905.1 hypothetical protein CHCC20368_1430 [Bacillus licheniformis]TWK51507.1 hypothetical protein CHCC20345_2674 [Bacillus licheniformis]TWK61057.1 hypothetical protein CHCC20343_2497 [Bacillus licheniformis]